MRRHNNIRLGAMRLMFNTVVAPLFGMVRIE
jgi:hypothetical protein